VAFQDLVQRPSIVHPQKRWPFVTNLLHEVDLEGPSERLEKSLYFYGLD